MFTSPKKRLFKRAWDDWNEASGLYETSGAPDPYFIVTPEVVRQDLNRPTYQSLMRPRKKARVMVVRKKRTTRKRTGSKRKRAPKMFGASIRKDIGKPMGFKLNVKSSNQASIDVVLANQVLYNYDLDVLPFGSGKHERDLDRVVIRGIKTYWSIHNLMAATLGPNGTSNVLAVNMAWVGYKNDTDDNVELDFFKSHGAERATNFVSVSPTTMFREALNTDKFAVLKRIKFTLTPQLAGQSGYYKTRKTWIPVKRQVTYETATDTQPKIGRIGLLVWVTGLFDNFATTRAETAYLSHRSVCYFTDAD